MRKIGARFYLSLGLGSLFIFALGCESSCTRQESPAGKDSAKLQENVAATVNGKEILLQKLDHLHSRAVEKFRRTNRPVSPDLERKLRGSILRRMIDDEVIKQKADKNKITIDRFKRVEALEDYKRRMGGEKGFKLFLKSQNLSEEEVVETILSERRREKLVEKLAGAIKINEKEILSHYNANKKLYTLPERVRARHILLKLSKNDPDEKRKLVLKKAEQILTEAKKPGADFVKLVQKYSEGPSIKTGGDLGFFPRGRMVRSFELAAFKAPLRTPVGPVKTEFGYHIIYVEEKMSASTAPLKDVRDRVVEFVTRNKRARATEDLLFKLRKNSKIKIYDYSMTQEEYIKRSTEEQKTAQQARKKTKK